MGKDRICGYREASVPPLRVRNLLPHCHPPPTIPRFPPRGPSLSSSARPSLHPIFPRLRRLLCCPPSLSLSLSLPPSNGAPSLFDLLQPELPRRGRRYGRRARFLEVHACLPVLRKMRDALFPTKTNLRRISASPLARETIFRIKYDIMACAISSAVFSSFRDNCTREGGSNSNT